MATSNQRLEYILARICADLETELASRTFGTDMIINPEQILKEADEYYGSASHTTMTLAEKENEKLLDSQVAELYKIYPSRCIVTNRPLGKSAKDKETLKIRIKVLGYDIVKNGIQTYVKNCQESNVYMKNFNTFLNNIPLEEEPKEEIKQQSQWQ